MKQKMDNKTSGCQFTVAAGRNPSVFVLLSIFCFVDLLACVPIQNNSLKEPEVRMVKFTWCEHPMDETTKKKCERVPLMPEPYVLQRGWVMVGEFSKVGSDCSLTNAAVIRYWGTTKGLGEIAENG